MDKLGKEANVATGNAHGMDKVANEAKENGEENHFGYLFGIMVEKGSEYPEGDPRRYFKYRVVFQGNNVKDQTWDVALFNEMQSTPATLEASKIADIYSHASLDMTYKRKMWNKHIFKLNSEDLLCT